METLRYYFEDGTHVIFDKYTIDTNGNVRNKKTEKVVKYFKDGDYNSCGVYDIEVKKRKIKCKIVDSIPKYVRSMPPQFLQVYPQLAVVVGGAAEILPEDFVV